MTPNKLRPIALAFPLLLAAGLLGCSDTEDATQNPIDTVPPAVPINLSISADQTVLVSWQENSEPDLQGYVLQRSLDQGATWAAVSASPLTQASWEDQRESRIEYRVAAVDLSENQSAYSETATYLGPSGGKGTKIPSLDE